MDKYTTILAIPEIDDTTINKARGLFFAYRDKGIISNCLFDDDIWHLNNEMRGYNFDFRLDADQFKEFEFNLQISKNDFKLFLKTFIICQMGELGLVSLQSIILAIKKVIYEGTPKFDTILSIQNGAWVGRIADFFSMIPGNNRHDQLIEWLNFFDEAEDMVHVSNTTNKRSLASFESYFRFNDILKKYWKECSNTEEKLFFFPIWMWWNISGILPLRPCEFVVTPRNCIRKINEKYILSVRRNRIKGASKKKSYKINTDYEINEYTIPKYLANEILWYLEETKDYDIANTNTLFVTETHYSMWDRCTPYTSRNYSYINLSTCLRYFYELIIHERYGYRILFDNKDRQLPNDNCIEYLHLGDTRHIALINMIAEGATPVVAMILAGHDNPEMSSHYYSNITQLIECRTYRQFKKQIKGHQSYSLSTKSKLLPAMKSIPMDNGGRCFSKEVANGDYTECYKAIGPGGEIGFCLNCTFYRDNSKSFSDTKQMYERKIQNECEMLSEIVKKVRIGKGYTEEINAVLLKLRDSDYSYSQYLLETMEEKKNGTQENI